jgi:outer membrane protein assembly factor BamB
MAIDLDKGQRIWWLQPFPHDPYDYDCNWSGILAEISGLGKVYIKGCKEGRLYIIEAATGNPIYIIDVAEEQKQWGQISDLKSKYHLTDPFSYYDLREWGWPDNGKYCGSPCDLYPMFLNGLFSTDMSYDPQTQTLYHYASALSAEIESQPYKIGHSVAKIKHIYPWNTTIVARDVATGNVKWTWFYRYSMQRSHLVVTGGIVYSGFTDGGIRFFDKDTGNLLYTVNVGSPIVVGPTIGKDSEGESKIFVITGSTSMVGGFAGPGFLNIGPSAPGTLIALGLADSSKQLNSTVVQTTNISGTLSETTTVDKFGSESTDTIIISGYIIIAITVILVIGFVLLELRKIR